MTPMALVFVAIAILFEWNPPSALAHQQTDCSGISYEISQIDNPKVLRRLALECFVKEGPNHDLAKAVDFLEKAFLNGDDEAFELQNNRHYLHVRELVARIRVGSEMAQLDLARLYHRGNSFLPKNLTEEERIYQESSIFSDPFLENDPEVQYHQGRRFEFGFGVGKDEAKAFQYYKKSAEQGFAPAQNKVGYYYDFGISVKKDLDQGIDYYQKSANQGWAPAQYNLGCRYYQGDGVEKDLEKAVEYFKKSAEQGFSFAQYRLGFCYHMGSGVQKDLETAFNYFKDSAVQGNSEGQQALGTYYENGHVVRQNLAQAIEYYKKSKEQGNVWAARCLADIYHHGRVGPVNIDKAIECYRFSAQNGNAESQYDMGNFYRNGVHVKKDLNQALEWYQKAAAQGNSNAVKEVAKLTRKLGIKNQPGPEGSNESRSSETWKKKLTQFFQPSRKDSDQTATSAHNFELLASDEGFLVDGEEADLDPLIP